jgi:DNA polymerase-3 subunit delta'
VCASCRKAAGGNHEHIYCLQPDGNSIKDAQTEELQSFLLKKPYDDERTFIIIDGAGLMTARAQNRILKTLEEPPAKITFILLAENAQSLAITILSRCVLIKFKPLARSEIMEFLAEKGIQGQQGETIAALSFGLPGRAASLLSADDLAEKRKAVAASVFGLLAGRPYYQCSADLAGWTGSKDDALELLNMMQGMFRDVLLLQAGAEKDMIINLDYFAQMLQASARTGRKRLVALIQGTETARNDIALNININYAIKNMMLCE